MSNPYQSPSYEPGKFSDLPAYAPPQPSYAGIVQQVRVVAILNIVQGFLEIPMGLLTMSVGFLFPVLMAIQNSNPNIRKDEGPPKEFLWVMTIMYVALGTPPLVGGIVRIVAGFRNYQYKSRTLGFVSFILGMGSVFSCYCAPTAIGVLVYGLIVFLNPGVGAAFQMGQEGRSSEEILASFYAPQPKM